MLNELLNTNIIQLGGSIRKNSFSVIGDYTLCFFEDVSCSKVFLGVDGIDSDYGITNSNIDEAHLNKRMIDASLKTIILSDSSKFGKRGFGRICCLEQVDIIVTDSDIPDLMVNIIESAGVKLVIAEW